MHQRRSQLWHAGDGTTGPFRPHGDHYGGDIQSFIIGYLPTLGSELFLRGHGFKVVKVFKQERASGYIIVQSLSSKAEYDLTVDRFVEG